MAPVGQTKAMPAIKKVSNHHELKLYVSQLFSFSLALLAISAY